MKTQDILDLDYRKEESRAVIEKVLRKVKPFDKLDSKSEITMAMLEKAVGRYCRKYTVMMQYITPSFLENEVNWFTCSMKETQSHKWLGNVYASTMYELFAKSLIKIYASVKASEIIEREAKDAD